MNGTGRGGSRTWRAAGAASLGGVYLLMMPGAETGDLAMAAVVALLAYVLTGRGELRLAPPPEPRGERRPGPPPLGTLAGGLVVFARGAVAGAWRVAKLSLGLGRPPPSGFLEVPIGARSPRAAAVLGLVATLSPGTVLVRVDRARGVLLFHVVGEDEEEFRRELERLWPSGEDH